MALLTTILPEPCRSALSAVCVKYLPSKDRIRIFLLSIAGIYPFSSTNLITLLINNPSAGTFLRSLFFNSPPAFAPLPIIAPSLEFPAPSFMF